MAAWAVNGLTAEVAKQGPVTPTIETPTFIHPNVTDSPIMAINRNANQNCFIGKSVDNVTGLV